MRLLNEKSIGIVLLCIGIAVIVLTQMKISNYVCEVNINPGPDWPKGIPLCQTLLTNCPIGLVYGQMMGVVLSTVGATVLVHKRIQKPCMRAS